MESQPLWVGLVYTAEGVVRTADGAREIVVGDEFADLGTAGDDGDGEQCISTIEGRFNITACATSMRFICAYSYSGEGARGEMWDPSRTVGSRRENCVMYLYHS